jgi:ketosteroid isomerase-like protein
MMDAVSVEQVCSAVHRYWDAIAKKAKEKLTASYASDALVFMADSKRTEPARLVIERRNREYFGEKGSAEADIGPIEVQLSGPDVAIATYPYRFHAMSVRQDRRFRIDMPAALATQIFRRDADGELRIVHEHLSSAKNPTISTLGPEA